MKQTNQYDLSKDELYVLNTLSVFSEIEKKHNIDISALKGSKAAKKPERMHEAISSYDTGFFGYGEFESIIGNLEKKGFIEPEKYALTGKAMNNPQFIEYKKKSNKELMKYFKKMETDELRGTLTEWGIKMRF